VTAGSQCGSEPAAAPGVSARPCGLDKQLHEGGHGAGLRQGFMKETRVFNVLRVPGGAESRALARGLSDRGRSKVSEAVVAAAALL
jgi:hypothetical protein